MLLPGLLNLENNVLMPSFLLDSFQNGSPLFQELPAFLHRTNYKNVTDGKATVFQLAHNTHLDMYTWFSQNPVNNGSFFKYMGLEEKNRGRWLDLYPFERETLGWDAHQPVFVDIGGNVGYYCAKFKEKFPKVPGRVILQDLPSTLAHALPTSGVEAMGHDFFTPQGIKSKATSILTLSLPVESF